MICFVLEACHFVQMILSFQHRIMLSEKCIIHINVIYKVS